MKTAIVTGANRGLGKGFVEYLIEHGYFVFACARNCDTITKTDNCIPISMDISNNESINDAATQIKKHVSHIDLLINNAGVNSRTSSNNQPEKASLLAQLDRQTINTMFDINATSQMIVIQQLADLLTDESYVLNISSDRASFHDEFENSTANYGYRSSKIALNMLTFCLTWDLPSKITAVHPGSVETESNPYGSINPYDAAEQIITNIVDNWRDEFRGAFTRFDGSLYPL